MTNTLQTPNGRENELAQANTLFQELGLGQIFKDELDMIDLYKDLQYINPGLFLKLEKIYGQKREKILVGILAGSIYKSYIETSNLSFLYLYQYVCGIIDKNAFVQEFSNDKVSDEVKKTIYDLLQDV